MPNTITNNSINKMQFGQLRPSGIFLYSTGQYFMKLESVISTINEGEFNAVNLDRGYITWFSDDEEVEIVTEISIKTK